MTDETQKYCIHFNTTEWLLREVVRMRVALTQIRKLHDKPGELLDLYIEAMKIAREALGTDER